MENIFYAFRNLGAGRILAMFIGMGALVAMLGTVYENVNTPGLSLLYGNLNANEASEIKQFLDNQAIPNEVRENGSVYVPANQVGDLRLQVAGAGMVGGSTAGYEVFDDTSAFGTTSFVQNINAKRALEGELARTVMSLPAVSGARIHLVLPKRQAFSRQSVTPSAGVALNLGNRVIEDGQVQSIARLVAAAVPDLSTEHVTIIDQRGTLLYDGRDQQTLSAASNNKMQRQIEQSYESRISSMLEKVLGAGRVSIRVHADINFDQLEEKAEIYDPAGQVVRSEQRSEDIIENQQSTGGPPVGLAGNIPGEGDTGTSVGSNENQTRTEETINYEVSKTLRSFMRAGGEIEKLGVAVLLADAGDDEGATGLTDEQRQSIETLVKTAIGFEAERGDTVEIIALPFTAPPEIPEVDTPFVNQDQIIDIAKQVLLVLGVLLTILLVVRPALKVLSSSTAPPPLPAQASAALQQVGPVGQGGAAAAPPGTSPDGLVAGAAAESNSMIDMANVQGKVRESTVKKVSEIIEAHPEESLGVVRSWMNSSVPNTQDS